MTNIYFVRHAEPNYNNHDDLTRELSPKGFVNNELRGHNTTCQRVYYP